MSDPQAPNAQQPAGPPQYGPPPTGPGYAAPMPGPVPQKNFFARHKILTALGVVVVIGVAIGIGSGGSKSEDAKPAAAASPTASSGSAESADSAAEAKPTPDDVANNAKQGTRENPFPVDTPATLGDWTVSVGASNTNAAEAILAENSFNKPPADGRQFVMAPITMTYNGKDSEIPWVNLSFKFVGSKGNAYSGADTDASCGVIPNNMLGVSELYAGASATANECMSVPVDEIVGGTWVIDEPFSMSGDKAFFAVG